MSKLKKAMAKAKEARESGKHIYKNDDDGHPTTFEKAMETDLAIRKTSIRDEARKVDAEKVETSRRKSARSSDRSDVSISYSKTKVQAVDREALKNKKLISLFQGLEGTEQIKTLRTQILSKLKEIGGNSILVTSANPGEGKTFTSINLGISIAQELDHTVLIVDADLKQPANGHFDFAQDFFCVDVHSGLSHYLTEEIELPDLLLNPGIQKLTILPGGKALDNSTELLGSPRMEALVNEMRSRYKKDRIVIFDTSSVLTCPDPVVLSKFVDGILLVVEEEKTSTEQLKRVMELLKDCPVLGSVLNKSKCNHC